MPAVKKFLAAAPRTLMSAFGLGPRPRVPDWVEAVAMYRNNTFLDRDECQIFVTSLIERSVISAKDPAIFALSELTGQPLNKPGNMALTLDGCEAICGPQTFYADAGPRFMTWILPSV